MNDTQTAVISAFLDHEVVDPDALGAALDDPEGRAALVDFVRIRQGVGGNAEPMPASLETLRRRRLPAIATIRWPAAAALLVLVFLAGWMAPRPSSREALTAVAPPEPARLEKFVPGVDWSYR